VAAFDTLQSRMHNGAQIDPSRVTWKQKRSRPKLNSARWNKPELQNGSSVFWHEVQVRRAPRSELSRQIASAQEIADILDALT
jgi:hypothetical protein